MSNGLNKLRVRAFAIQAMKIKSEAEMVQLMERAMSDGMSQGRSAKESEVRTALKTLGFHDDAFWGADK